MANHGYMTTKRFMTVEQIDGHLRTFMEKRFPGIDYEIEGPFDMDREVCRLMCSIHGWELVDETVPVLDRIVKAINDAEQVGK